MVHTFLLISAIITTLIALLLLLTVYRHHQTLRALLQNRPVAAGAWSRMYVPMSRTVWPVNSPARTNHDDKYYPGYPASHCNTFRDTLWNPTPKQRISLRSRYGRVI